MSRDSDNTDLDLQTLVSELRRLLEEQTLIIPRRRNRRPFRVLQPNPITPISNIDIGASREEKDILDEEDISDEDIIYDTITYLLSAIGDRNIEEFETYLSELKEDETVGEVNYKQLITNFSGSIFSQILKIEDPQLRVSFFECFKDVYFEENPSLSGKKLYIGDNQIDIETIARRGYQVDEEKLEKIELNPPKSSPLPESATETSDGYRSQLDRK